MLPVRVLLVDDDTLVRRAVRQILEAADDLEVVGEASDGDGAVRQAPQADVVLMDLRMPGMSGVEATSRITHSPSSPKVVVLTTVTADAAITDAVHAGASGFLLKASSPDDIVNAVRAVHAGDAFMSPTSTVESASRYSLSGLGILLHKRNGADSLGLLRGTTYLMTG